ncbi:MAG: hypothetical protein FWC64_09550 [Treponema sp.]|nr:hypothetical protein [Treponema sp.]
MNACTFNRNYSRLFFAACVFAFAVLLAPLPAPARDFGLLLNQSAVAAGDVAGNGGGEDWGADYEAALIPRFSSSIGDAGSLYLSASLAAVYEASEWRFVPELLRAEISWGMGAWEFSAGRMIWQDPLRLVSSGLFDGARVARHTPRGTFGAGLWYTGFLYKNRVNIAMTDDDTVQLQTELDWDSFADTYFASRRAMAALYWQHPSAAELFELSFALIGQADLNDRYIAYHSQYFVARAALPLSRFIFELGGAVEAGQTVAGGSTDVSLGLAADAGIHWIPAAPFPNMLSLTGRFSSGYIEGTPLDAFRPITALPHGEVLRAEIPGLSTLGLRYTARLRPEFSLSLSAQHFVLSDLATFTAWPLTGGGTAGGYFLGTEFFGRVIWSPVSDMTLNLGAGVFVPALGDAAPSEAPRLLIELAAIFALR